MLSSRNRRAPRIQATLRCLATMACEKCGLEGHMGSGKTTRQKETTSVKRIGQRRRDYDLLEESKNPSPVGKKKARIERRKAR